MCYSGPLSRRLSALKGCPPKCPRTPRLGRSNCSPPSAIPPRVGLVPRTFSSFRPLLADLRPCPDHHDGGQHDKNKGDHLTAPKTVQILKQAQANESHAAQTEDHPFHGGDDRSLAARSAAQFAGLGRHRSGAKGSSPSSQEEQILGASMSLSKASSSSQQARDRPPPPRDYRSQTLCPMSGNYLAGAKGLVVPSPALSNQRQSSPRLRRSWVRS